MKLRLALTAATCLALPIIAQSSAQAQPVTGPYVSLGAGTALETSSPSGYKYYTNNIPLVRSNARTFSPVIESDSYKN
jgi:hypothetical protein